MFLAQYPNSILNGDLITFSLTVIVSQSHCDLIFIEMMFPWCLSNGQQERSCLMTWRCWKKSLMTGKMFIQYVHIWFWQLNEWSFLTHMSFVISSVAMIPKDLFKMFVLFLAGSLAKKSRDSAGCNTLCTSKPKPWGNETLADRFKKSKYIRAISTTQKRTYSESWSHGYRNVSWKHVFNIFCRVTYPRNITYCK